jgi:glutaminyl-peptide cyclotransferase
MNLINRGSLGILTACLLVLLLSCCRKNSPQRLMERAGRNNQKVFDLKAPLNNTVITCGDTVRIMLEKAVDKVFVDSVIIRPAKSIPVTFKGLSGPLYWLSGQSRVGRVTLGITVYYNDSLSESHPVSLVVLSDVIPLKYSYQVIKKYPHDNTAYTQGLIYDQGIMYESTGLEGKSSVRIVNVITGVPEKLMPLENQYFGEGIALYQNQIYQITYQSKVGFVYDKSTLQRIRSFDYPVSEGWGLTTDGKQLIMSDGTSQLYLIEPEFFTQADKIEVFDQKGKIDSLNELEYINGNIFANIYGQTYILKIDPANGKVTGILDLRDLMPEGSIGDYSKVLNGIAYNAQSGHIYVTGKNWPVLYELALTPSLK